MKHFFGPVMLATFAWVAIAQAAVIRPDVNGVNRCYETDSRGRIAIGSSAPEACSQAIALRTASDGRTNCFYIDANGAAFDDALDTSACFSTASAKSSALSFSSDFGRGERGGPGRGRPQPPPPPSRGGGGRGGGGGGGRSDGQCYLDRYPDICQNSPKNYCRDPEKHYRDYGRNEGRTWGCN